MNNVEMRVLTCRLIEKINKKTVSVIRQEQTTRQIQKIKKGIID